MNYKMTGHFIAQILLLEALFMIPAMFISLYLSLIHISEPTRR